MRANLKTKEHKGRSLAKLWTFNFSEGFRDHLSSHVHADTAVWMWWKPDLISGDKNCSV